MKTMDVMTREPRFVRVLDRLDAAARLLWDHDCGIAPVVDASGVLVGVITDRDLCMAAYTQGRALGDIAVSAVMSRSVRSCRPDDPLATVLQTMAEVQVHRLPVVDARGALVGIVSTNDLVRAAHGRPAAVDVAGVIRTLATIGAPRRKAAPATAPLTGPVASAPAAKAAPAAAAATVVVPQPSQTAVRPAPRKPKGKKG